MNLELKEWLEQCPQPVVARVIDSGYDLKHLMSTHFVYEDGMLVVIDLKSIADYMEDNV